MAGWASLTMIARDYFLFAATQANHSDDDEDNEPQRDSENDDVAKDTSQYEPGGWKNEPTSTGSGNRWSVHIVPP